MDPLFERRELTKKVNIHAKFIQKDIRNSLLSQLKVKYQGRCSAEGYIHKDSLTVLDWSVGRPNMRGGVDYFVKFHADICLPHIGQTFKAPVILRSKIGVHAEVDPIKILIPRDLHIGNQEFDDVKQGDESVVVVGKLKSRIAPPPEQYGETVEETVAPVPTSSGEEKSVMVVPSAAEKPKRRRLKPTTPSNT